MQDSLHNDLFLSENDLEPVKNAGHWEFDNNNELLDENEEAPRTEVTPETPFNECLHCEFNRNGCSFANLLATDVKRTCEILQAQRIRLGLTYKDVADMTGMSPLTVMRILTGQVKNPSFYSMHKINNALVGDPKGKFPCAKKLILEKYGKNSAEVQNLKEKLEDSNKKVDFLKEQVKFKENQMLQKDKLLEERADYLRIKDKYIGRLAVALGAALLIIAVAIIADRLDPTAGFFWRGAAAQLLSAL